VNGVVLKGIAGFRLPNHLKRARRRTWYPTATIIISGFPLYPCSWCYRPIVPVALTRSMIRCLDSVCLKQAAFRREFDDAKHKKRALRVVNGV
jgi:hypothetical protein